MDQAQSRSQVKQKKVVAETVDGKEVYVGDHLFWYDTFRDVWRDGEIYRDETGICGIYGTGYSMSELSWTVAEGQIKANHIFVLNKTQFFKSHEVEYITGRGR